MTLEREPGKDYEDIVLWVLAFEVGGSDKVKTDEKIRQELRDRNLGAYEDARIAPLRAFKDAIQEEVCRREDSKYYTHRHGRYEDSQDFDRNQMTQDYIERFPNIPRATIARFVDFAVYIYYIR